MNRECQRKLPRWALVVCIALAPAPVLAQNASAPADLENSEIGPTGEKIPLKKRSPLVKDPQTPQELLEATLLMVDIARLDLAKVYFDKLLSQDLDDDAILALRDQFGAGVFLRLVNIKELGEGAAKLLDRSNAVALKRADDAPRVAALLEQLDGDAEQQAVAEGELRGLGTLAVPTLIKILGDGGQAKLHENAMITLVRMGAPAAPMLVGALAAPSQSLRERVVTVLGYIRSRDVASYLWYSAASEKETPSVRAAARLALARIFDVAESGVDRIASQGTTAALVKSARDHYRRQYVWADAQQGFVTLWMWDDAAATVVPRRLSTDEASDVTGSLFAQQALALSPESREVQIIYLSLALAAVARHGEIDAPLPTGPGTAHDLALSVGAEVTIDVLTEALVSNRAVTAVAALKILQQVGTPALLSGPGAKPPVLVAALDYPDAGVQFAAAATILQLDPQQPFRGATRVVEVLKRAAATTGKPHAVVGEVAPQRGAQVAGFLRELGFEPILCLNGREAFEAATGRSDVELVVLHPNIVRWALSETLANLRADARTANVPIVLHSPERVLPQMKSYLRNYRRVSLASLSQTTDDFEMQFQTALEQSRTPALNARQHAAQRLNAVRWMAYIAQGRRLKIFDLSGCFDVLAEALADPTLAPPALDALAELSSQAAQRRIAELVLDRQASENLRVTAAARLAAHMQRFGLLLPKSTIDALHAAWKTSQEATDVRTALGGVIGSLKPDAALVGRRLETFSATPE